MVRLSHSSTWSRHLRTSRSSTHDRKFTSSIRTLPNPTPESLTSFLQSHPVHPDDGSVTCYIISPELSSLPALLRAVQRERPNSIGSFAAGCTPSIPSIGIATFSPSTQGESVHVFRSGLVGRPPTSVGRWHREDVERASRSQARSASPSTSSAAPSDRRTHVGDLQRAFDHGVSQGGESSTDKDGWNALWGGGVGMEGFGSEDVPVGLQGLERNIRSLLLLSDATPEPLLSLISPRFPTASVLGLITHPTPFLTGRPYTLIHGNDIHDDGAVGIAFCSADAEGGVQVGIDYGGLEPLGDVAEIADAQGNLLLLLAGSSPNPTQTLIRHIQAYRALNPLLAPSGASTASRGITLGQGQKDEEYYLALVGGEEGANEVQRVVRIMSGDPSRGAVSLEMEEPLRVGQKVQFMHRPPTKATSNTCLEIGGGITFSKLPEEQDISALGSTSSPSQGSNSISVATEGGFIFSPRGEEVDAAVCRVNGATGWMKVA